MVLSDFINRHAGETAWLFGKGPSLSNFDFKTAGPLRVAINDVVAHVPGCTYGFANDGVGKWRDCYKRGQILFQPKRCLHEFDSTAQDAVACDVVVYNDTYDDRLLMASREEIAEHPAIRRGTLGSALQILHVMGVRSVYMVGIDGGGKHADGYDWKTRLRSDHAKDYNAIRSAAIDSAFLMGIAMKFHNKDHTMEPNGRIYVRFLSNAFAEGNPYSQGEIASFGPRVAAELIACRAAEQFTPTREQVEPRVETASAPIEARETATIPTKKTRKFTK